MAKTLPNTEANADLHKLLCLFFFLGHTHSKQYDYITRKSRLLRVADENQALRAWSLDIHLPIDGQIEKCSAFRLK
ncbi:hypothetical protein EV426DRAFT_591596 [Tirmania nivea]|nr:hypothetical protein EV426DRAFT_591596 [Tirmania nivea]